jgi:hypothetical protein
MRPSGGVQAPLSAADDGSMTKLVLSLFRRAPRRRIAILHGPRTA